MYQLGIDIGSTTIKMALLCTMYEGSTKVLATAYERHNAAPAEVGRKMMEKMLASVESQKSKDRPSGSKLKGEEKISVAITGSKPRNTCCRRSLLCWTSAGRI